MTRIRKLYCFDYPRIKKLISYLGSEDDDKFEKLLTDEPACLLNTLLPLKYKFKPESYILSEDKEIFGIITAVSTPGNPYKINFSRLIFKENFYNVGKQLIEFIMARYGAKGAHCFNVLVDNCHDELLKLFIDGCGFRQCSYENLWKLDNFIPQSQSKSNFRPCLNSDAGEIASLFNNELNNLYKPSMERLPQEYYEPVLAGFSKFYKNRYVLEYTGRLIAYLSITTVDNLNFIIDISTNEGYRFDYDEILNFALGEIARKKTSFTAFLKQRQYARTADVLEEYLHSRNLSCIRTQCVLVKDFYKPITQTEGVLKVFLNNIAVN